MYCVRNVTEDLYWVGMDDRRLELFENIHPIPEGVSYNSYLLMDEKTVLFDTVDWSASRQLLENIEHVLNGRQLNYMVIHHMEPDHGACIEEILRRYPDVTIISTKKAFTMMEQFGFHVDNRSMDPVKEGDTRNFGKHTVTFLSAPMVHWPEVMVTFDTTNGVVFSADAFGTFGALDGRLFNDEINFDEKWIEYARRYYTNIVGKYGPQVQALLGKVAKIMNDIEYICPLHGPVWRNKIDFFLDKYQHWSAYESEEQGVMIAYASMYGNTEAAGNALASKLCEKGMTNVVMHDVSNTHVSYLISDTFKYSHVVLASVTYNMGIYPVMHNYLNDMKALNIQNKTFGIIENGSWACKVGSLMEEFIENETKNNTVLKEVLSLKSSLSNDKAQQLDIMANAIINSIKR